MFMVQRESGVETMDREVISQLLIFIKFVMILGIIGWNVVRIVQIRHCWNRKEPCENSQCEWRYFCDKHGGSLTVDLYRMKKLKK